MKSTLIVGIGASLLTAGIAKAQQRQDITPRTPNVLFIYADDLGYGDLECYDGTQVKTPNINRLAKNGIRFTNAHATASTSTPSRYSMLTGEYAWRRPGTDIAAGNAGMIIRPERYTIADMFKNAGYATAAIGKWHLGLGDKAGEQDWNAPLPTALGDLGFDYSYIMAATADRVPCVFIENGQVANYDPDAPIYVSYQQNFPGEPTGKDNPELLYNQKPSFGHDQSIVNGISRIGYMKGGGKALWRDEDIADTILTSAVRFMEENANKPFFMYLCTNDVHVPRMPHERFRGKSPMGLRGEAILQFDYTVGAVADALKRLKLDDNTLLIITSDNGPVLDDGYQDEAVSLAGDHKPGGPWRGGKYSAYEAGTAVPFIVNWPGHTPQGMVSDALVSHIDYMATLAEIIGAKVPLGAGTDSQPHADTWLGRNTTPRPYVLSMAQNRTLTLRTAQYKYIEPSNGAAKINTVNIETGYNAKPQLFDIQKDRGETKNLFTALPEVGKSMQTMMAELRQPFASGDTCFWYNLVTPNRANRCVTSTGAGKGLVGKLQSAGAASEWKFVKRTDGETYDIVNHADGSYIVPGRVVRPALQLTTSATPPATGWAMNTSGIMRCLFSVTNGTSQFNQSVNAPNYFVLNWGDGKNTTDAGCLYAAMLVTATAEPSTGIHETIIEGSGLIVKDGRLCLKNSDEPVVLYDLTGKRLSAKQLPKQPGIYIATVGQRSFKVMM